MDIPKNLGIMEIPFYAGRTDGGNPSIKACRGNIKRARDLINGRWSEYTRAKTNMSIEELASTIDEVLFE